MVICRRIVIAIWMLCGWKILWYACKYKLKFKNLFQNLSSCVYCSINYSILSLLYVIECVFMVIVISPSSASVMYIPSWILGRSMNILIVLSFINSEVFATPLAELNRFQFLYNLFMFDVCVCVYLYYLCMLGIVFIFIHTYSTFVFCS